MKHLNDDRLGRCLDRLFEGIDRSLIMELVKHVIRHFDLSLDELHNDSTTVTFHGAYDDASWSLDCVTACPLWGLRGATTKIIVLI